MNGHKESWEERLKELTRQRDEAGRQHALVQMHVNGLTEQRDTAIRQRDAAIALLKRYGRHFSDCDLAKGWPPCDCGFDAALNECEGAK